MSFPSFYLLALYCNNGGGSCLTYHWHRGDFDRDADTEVFVLNDVAGNFLFRNDGTGEFQEVAMEAGVAYNSHGKDLGR